MSSMFIAGWWTQKDLCRIFYIFFQRHQSHDHTDCNCKVWMLENFLFGWIFLCLIYYGHLPRRKKRGGWDNQSPTWVSNHTYWGQRVFFHKKEHAKVWRCQYLLLHFGQFCSFALFHCPTQFLFFSPSILQKLEDALDELVLTDCCWLLLTDPDWCWSWLMHIFTLCTIMNFEHFWLL